MGSNKIRYGFINLSFVDSKLVLYAYAIADAHVLNTFTHFCIFISSRLTSHPFKVEEINEEDFKRILLYSDSDTRCEARKNSYDEVDGNGTLL